jgi:hypothetical protein
MEGEVQERKFSIMLMRLKQAEPLQLLKKSCALIRRESKFMLKDLFQERISIGLKSFLRLRR